MTLEFKSDLKSFFLTVLVVIILYLIFFNIILKQPLLIKPSFEFIDVALGTDESGTIGQNDNIASYTKESEAVTKNIESKVQNPTENTQVLSDGDIEIPSKPKKKEHVKTNPSTTPTSSVPAAPKAVLKKREDIQVNNPNSNVTHSVNQGDNTKPGIKGTAEGNPESANFNVSKSLISIVKGDRKIQSIDKFKGDVPAATIYASVLVKEDGTSKFIDFESGSSSYDKKYQIAITNYLKRMHFDISDHSSLVIIKFNFIVE
ncbi:MAG: hypothetical protein QM539_01305 [Alphaproteobacteria bacterium]|nr:hypothetical protein [Alphaproteobacteria bacterium]